MSADYETKPDDDSDVAGDRRDDRPDDAQASGADRKAVDEYVFEPEHETDDRRRDGGDEEVREDDESPGFADPEPWDEPVSSTELMLEVIGVIRKHTRMHDYEQLAVALWIIFTYVYHRFTHSPFLALQSPTMRCGKSIVLAVLAALVSRGMAMAFATGASIFRLIDEWRPTVLIDELDVVIKQNRDLRVVLNAAHNRNTASIPRVVRGRTVLFKVFGPKAMACIGALPSTLQDRSIVINMRRLLQGESVDPLPCDAVLAYGDVRRKIARWAADFGHRIAPQSTCMPAGLNSRAADNWRPLLAVADALAPEWGVMARESAIDLSRVADMESVDMNEQLIRDIHRIIVAKRWPKHIPVDELHRGLIKMDDGVWAEFERGHPLTKHRMGRMLVPFGVRSFVERVKMRVVRVYRIANLKDAFARYCADDTKSKDAA
jgi:putative DNA primase/helicase